jgi:HPt (histidine-containing phosphotransfer) domain-containing protein
VRAKRLLETVARRLPERPAGALDAVLDPEVLAQLATDLDHSILPDLVEAFLREAETRSAVMVAAAVAGELRPLEREAHSLKSSAGTFGAATLAARAREIEAACRAGDGRAAAELSRALPDITRKTVEALAARGLARAPAAVG